jgi:hypothetical protein
MPIHHRRGCRLVLPPVQDVFKLPDQLHHELEREAAARGVSKSAVIRDSLERTLRNKAGKRVSCLDLMRDLVGIFDGPPDLSANKKKYIKEAIMADYERQQQQHHR